MRDCPFDKCFAELASLRNLPVVFFATEPPPTGDPLQAKFTVGIGRLLDDLYPNFTDGLTVRDALKNDSVSLEHWLLAFDGHPQHFNLINKGRAFTTILEPLESGGVQGISLMAVDEGAISRALVESDLNAAMELGQLKLALQPIVDLRTGKTVGQEGLIRWQKDPETLIMPDVFLPLAGRLMPEICLYVLRQAAKYLDEWSNDPVKLRWWLSINISPESINDGFEQRFNDVCSELGIAREKLHLEITEQAAENADIMWFLTLMRRLGHQGVMDDYGSSASGLIRLASLPFDVVKFDKQYIQSTVNARGHVDPGMAKTTISQIELCRQFHLKIIFEGIEYEPQRQWLLDHGIYLGQGYLFGKPQLV